jgi:hypothetical protein
MARWTWGGVGDEARLVVCSKACLEAYVLRQAACNGGFMALERDGLTGYIMYSSALFIKWILAAWGIS